MQEYKQAHSSHPIRPLKTKGKVLGLKRLENTRVQASLEALFLYGG
jgi:hypothetical protein